MINAGADNTIPQACTQALAEAIGMEYQVVWLQLGAVAMGYGDYPWMGNPEKKIFKGTLEPVPLNHPLEYANPQHMMKVNMAKGIVAAASMGTGIFDPFYRESQRR